MMTRCVKWLAGILLLLVPALASWADCFYGIPVSFKERFEVGAQVLLILSFPSVVIAVWVRSGRNAAIDAFWSSTREIHQRNLHGTISNHRNPYTY